MFFTKKQLGWLGVAALSIVLGSAALTTRAEADGKKKMTYCAWVDPSDGTHNSYCTGAPRDQAQKDCDAKLKKKNIEGTCECTDDQSFIEDRCK